MLRNSGSTEKALWDALRIGFAWRKSAASSLFRSLTLASLALVVLCVVAASSVLSAKAVLSHSTLGLIFSSNYGPLVFFTDHNYGDIPYVIMATKTTEEVNTATEYVNSCYRSVSGSQCNSSYVVQRLPYKVTTGAVCPFDNELCASSNGSVTIDTGLLDSRAHLGHNRRRCEIIL